MPTYNEIEGAWGPSDDEIDTAAERALLLKALGKAAAQPEPPPSTILFHPGLADREFGSHLLSVSKLTAWAAQQGLEVVTQPPIDQLQFVQVEALLCAIERATRESTPEPMAAAIVQATPHLAHDRAAEVAPRWLVGADAHQQWRRLIEKAVEAGELGLLAFGSKLPVQPIPDTQPQAGNDAPVVAGNAPAIQVNAMKKAALIAELEYEWSSIEADISDATRNGLKAAAHTGKHGEWDKGKARAWAVSKGKIKQTVPVHSLAGAWPGTTTRHTISP